MDGAFSTSKMYGKMKLENMNKEGNLQTWHILSQKLALTSPTSGGRSVGIVRLRTKATEYGIIGRIKVTIYSIQITFLSCCS
jgi:hypothetical protein